MLMESGRNRSLVLHFRQKLQEVVATCISVRKLFPLRLHLLHHRVGLV